MPNVKIQHYTDTFEELKSGLKWKVSDKKILMAIASTYVMNNKKLNPEKLLQLADEIKSRAGLFSSMKSYSRFTTAAVLDVHFENPLEQIPTLFQLYDEFKKAKFKSGVFTYIAASILLTNNDNKTKSGKLIENTKEIYEGMKSEHMFLTGASDYRIRFQKAHSFKGGMNGILFVIDEHAFLLL
ncbi:DUF4003 family protein [Virgibacillus indicus]|uniref:DUF4003 family protein n=1 Tax=Virgibacillus indicus TaxID=2024554 RepID=UPI0013FE4737|nr:DUF4003 family protein [Virgibacillus indicus]